MTGARYSQLARLVVDDLHDREQAAPRLTMPTSKKGKGTKKVGRNSVPIPAALAEKLRAQAAERPGDAALLIKPSGKPWSKSDHSRPFARAAGQDPETVTMYALRHTNIVRQLLAGVPARVVAVNHDTSIRMLEMTYSRHISDHADALARGSLLDLSEQKTLKVQGVPAYNRV